MATATEKEMEVAAILLGLSSTILARELPHHHVSIENLRWGAKRRCTPRRYRKKSKPDQTDHHLAGPKEAAPVVEREPASFAGVLCAQQSGSDAELRARPPKPVKKKKAKKDIIMERKKEVASLTKENEDLKRELAEQMEKLEKLREMNTNLKDQKTLDELNTNLKDHETLDELKMAGAKPTTKKSVKLVLKFKMEPIPLPPLELVTVTDDQNCRPEGDLRAQPSEDMAECKVKAPLMCQFDRDEKVAMSAHARKRRLEIVREKKVYKR